MPSRRLERVRELLKRQIGEAIRREIPAHEAGLITVNDVEVTGDLRSATVYTSFFGTPEQQKRAMQLLRKYRVRLQDIVAKSVVLKYTPRLRFAVDDSVEKADRVLQIIAELEKQESGGAGSS